MGVAWRFFGGVCVMGVTLGGVYIVGMVSLVGGVWCGWCLFCSVWLIVMCGGVASSSFYVGVELGGIYCGCGLICGWSLV